MAKVKIRGFRTIFKKLDESLKVALGAKLKKEVSEFAVKRIVGDARSQINAKTGKKLPKLSKSYMDARLGIVKFRTINGRVVPFQEPDEFLKTVDKQYFDPTAKRSNLTLSGTLLKSITGEVVGNEIIITVASTRKSEAVTNDQILEWLKELNPGYDFIGLDKKRRKRVLQIVKESIRRQIKKFNK